VTEAPALAPPRTRRRDWSGWLKRAAPRSLFGRALLIVVLPVLVLQTVVSALFIERHYDRITRQMAAFVAAELNYAVGLVEAAPDAAAAQAALDDLSPPRDMALSLSPGQVVDRAALRRFYDFTGGVVAETFKAEMRNPLSLDLVAFDKRVEARVQTGKGVLTALIDRNRMIPSNPHQLFVITALTAAALVTVAVLFLRNQVRPIRDLAAAADAFGKGRHVAFRPAGAEEVRRAGGAFLAMRARIERQIESRTRMLSGVSHDLRTPLTRIKLALSFLDGPEAEEIAEDAREMERMLEAFLAFARGEAEEEAEPLDPLALAGEVAEDARRGGARVELSSRIDTPDAPLAPMRRGSVKRALANLVGNAAGFGERVRLAVALEPRAVEFVVEDDGPGIAPADRETALKPFARLDEARNQDRGGGVGLGLSIAAEVARAHGGALALEDSPLGGLRARMRLPR
jgi:two-component system osmolarity sensor histidine kinase EnvZ